MHEAGESDAELMRRAAAGDRDAFAAVYRRHAGTVYRFARLMTGSATLAEDVVQEVFLELLRAAARYDATRSSLTTYLYGAARHRTRRLLLRQRRYVAFESAHERLRTLSAEDVRDLLAARGGDLERLRHAILSLPSRYREVIVLCELQQLSYADAAAAIGCAVGTVRSRLHRARQLLAAKLAGRVAPDAPSPSTIGFAV